MIAIVTGASSGIGAEFCRALDGGGYGSIWMIARGADRLEAVASGLRTPTRVIPADLSTEDGLSTVASILRAEAPDVGMLVCAAGMGRFGSTWGIPEDETASMIALNVTALTRVTAACIPYMGKGSAIVEVCSASAYLPLENLNVYSATKSYVRSFCEALRRELAPRGVRVLEVSPGWVSTGFIDSSRGRADVPDAVFRHTVTPEKVVQTALRDLGRGRHRSLCGAYNRSQVLVCRHLPSLAARIWRRSLHGGRGQGHGRGGL